MSHLQARISAARRALATLRVELYLAAHRRDLAACDQIGTRLSAVTNLVRTLEGATA